jgi:hypothetical protein
VGKRKNRRFKLIGNLSGHPKIYSKNIRFLKKKSSMKKVFIVLGSLLGAMFLLLIVYLAAHNIPVSVSDGSSTIVKKMRVDAIYEGGIKDIIFAQNNGEFYYINRGLEQGYTLEGLREQLLNKTVTLQVTNMLAGPSAHINELRLGDEVIFDENKTQYYNRNLRSENVN